MPWQDDVVEVFFLSLLAAVRCNIESCSTLRKRKGLYLLEAGKSEPDNWLTGLVGVFSEMSEN